MKEEEKICHAEGGREAAGAEASGSGVELSPEEAFYAEALAEAAAAAFARAMAIDGLEGEIALLRTRLLEVMEKQPERIDLCTKLAESIARLVNAQHRLAKGKKRGLKDNFAKILTDLAIPLGPVAVRLLLKRVNGVH